MYKKIIIIIALFLLTGCNTYNLDNMTLEDSVNLAIKSNAELYNVNNVGYRYYLPRGFVLEEDRENIQILKSEGIEYFLNVDLVSYYNKTEIARNIQDDLYEYVPITNGDKTGFLEIVKNNDYFLIKIVYNYAIIEAQVKEPEVQKSIINMGYIVSSIKYNDNVIKNKFGEDVLELHETTYQIFGPKKDEETKNYAYYLEQYNNYTGEIENTIKDPDVIEN